MAHVMGHLIDSSSELFLLGMLLIAVSGCESKGTTKTGNTLKSQEWWTYIADYDGEPGSTLVNLGLKKSAPMKDYQILLVTGVSYESPPTNSGLPLPTELTLLNELGERRAAVVAKQVQAVRVGIFTHKNERLDYFYVADSNGLAAVLTDFYRVECPTRKTYINIKNDEKWEAYLDFLYPNAQTIEFYRRELEKIDALR